MNNAIRKEVSKSAIIVSRIYKSPFQKGGTMTAELKQTITIKSWYPTKSIKNSLQDNIFTMTDFGFEEKEFVSKEVRVAWIDVPVETTKEQVEAKIASNSNITLYRILSNKPIISDTEQYAINNSDLDVDLNTFANRQAIRYPVGNVNAGELALDNNGKVQYRRIAFSTKNSEDTDMRSSDPANYYVSPELEAEVNHKVMEDQVI